MDCSATARDVGKVSAANFNSGAKTFGGGVRIVSSSRLTSKTFTPKALRFDVCVGEFGIAIARPSGEQVMARD